MPENVPGTEWQMLKTEDKIIFVGEHVKAITNEYWALSLLDIC